MPDPTRHTSQPVLEVRGLTRHFRSGGLRKGHGQAVQAVNDVSFTIPPGQALGLVGESGSGKSTLARCVLRIERSDAGEILLAGQRITHAHGATLRHARRDMQAVFQDPASSLNPRWTILRAITDPLLANGRQWNAARSRAVEVLELVGLPSRYLDSYPHQLSGGQQQRAGIARALMLDPALIVADEPLSALDVSIQAQVLNLLVKLKRELGISLLFISHDLRVTRHLCEAIAVCYLGRIVEMGRADDVLKRPQHPYTAALVSAMPLPLSESHGAPERIVLPGDPPSPLNPPSGCTFRTRCFRAQDRCAREAPRLSTSADGQSVACFFPLQDVTSAATN